MEALAWEPFATKVDFYAANCNCDLVAPTDDALVNEILVEATNYAVHLIQGAYRGRGSITLRPCRSSCACPGTCCCTIDRLPLNGPNPVITQVLIDGEVVDPATYTVMSWRGLPYLVRRRPTPDAFQHHSTWPGWQDLTLATTEPNTWSITYTWGRAPTILERDAVVEIACEMAMSLAENRVARLPRGTSSASFQGLSVQIDEDEDAGVGLVAVGRLMAFYLPGGKAPMGAWSPDLDEGWTFAG